MDSDQLSMLLSFIRKKKLKVISTILFLGVIITVVLWTLLFFIFHFLFRMIFKTITCYCYSYSPCECLCEWAFVVLLRNCSHILLKYQPGLLTMACVAQISIYRWNIEDYALDKMKMLVQSYIRNIKHFITFRRPRGVLILVQGTETLKN